MAPQTHLAPTESEVDPFDGLTGDDIRHLFDVYGHVRDQAELDLYIRDQAGVDLSARDRVD